MPDLGNEVETQLVRASRVSPFVWLFLVLKQEQKVKLYHRLRDYSCPYASDAEEVSRRCKNLE